MVSLQREVAVGLARRAQLLPPEQLPAAMALWSEVRRLGAIQAASPAAGGLVHSGGSSGFVDNVGAALRSRLKR